VQLCSAQGWRKHGTELIAAFRGWNQSTTASAGDVCTMGHTFVSEQHLGRFQDSVSTLAAARALPYYAYVIIVMCS
jgi:hypothetical protein